MGFKAQYFLSLLLAVALISSAVEIETAKDEKKPDAATEGVKDVKAAAWGGGGGCRWGCCEWGGYGCRRCCYAYEKAPEVVNNFENTKHGVGWGRGGGQRPQEANKFEEAKHWGGGGWGGGRGGGWGGGGWGGGRGGGWGGGGRCCGAQGTGADDKGPMDKGAEANKP